MKLAKSSYTLIHDNVASIGISFNSLIVTREDDIGEVLGRNKWQWAGHVARLTDERWTTQTTEWKPMYGGRNRGRPRTRWRDDLDESCDTATWRGFAVDRL